jgi:hypothetical protein
VAQVGEHLLCKCEAMNSNPSSTKKKKKRVEVKHTQVDWLETYLSFMLTLENDVCFNKLREF